MSYRNRFFVLFLALSAWSLPASAVQRVFVSAISGNDANTATGCAASAPCRWFAGAMSAVDAGGEMVAMDSGAYGAVTIAKSVSIIGAPGVYAGITVFSGNGVTIATPGVNVVLRGLTINGLGGSYGIYMTAGLSLTVDHCVVSNFSSGYGLYLYTAAKVAVLGSLITGNYGGAFFGGGATALVSNSRVLDNTYVGLRAQQSSSGTSKVTVNQSEASGSTYGFFAFAEGGGTTNVIASQFVTAGNTEGLYALASSSGTTRAELRDSVASGNSIGLDAFASGGTVHMSVSNSQISGNSSTGLWVEGSGATLTAGGNTVTRNGTGLFQAASGVLESTGDNIVRGNTTATSGTITAVTKM